MTDTAAEPLRPSGWQDDPLEGAWWLTAVLAIILFVSDPYYRSLFR